MTIQKIDCDIHPVLTSTKLLVPYLDPFWGEQIISRGIDGMELNSYPASMPLSSRPDWRDSASPAASRLDHIQDHVFDQLGATHAICNVLHGAMAVHDPYLGAALCSAINSWLAAEWLDKDTRLKASLMISTQNIAAAVEEIEKWAHDDRFVQVLLLSTGDTLLGEAQFWPIYKAAEKHGFTIGIHAGSKYWRAPTSAGWPSFRYEYYVAESQVFQSQILSLVYHGVFREHPGLKVVMMESGISWLPAFMWRADKTWRGLRIEIPWVERAPSEIIREHIRLTAQPFDSPPNQDSTDKLLEQIGSDEMFLFASDYPHWQFDGNDSVPSTFSADLVQRMGHQNPISTYSRLKDRRQ